MKPRSRYAKTQGRKPGVADPFVKVEVYLPQQMAWDLKEFARLNGTSADKCLVNAAYAGLVSCPDVLRIQKELPTQSTTLQASLVDRVYVWLLKAEGGIDLETLSQFSYDLQMKPNEAMGVAKYMIDTKIAELKLSGDGKYYLVPLKTESLSRTERYTNVAGQSQYITKRKFRRY